MTGENDPKLRDQGKKPNARGKKSTRRDDALPAKKKMGAPEFPKTPEVIEEILAHLADGKSMRTVCRMDGMPRMTTVFKWLREDTDFAKHYAQAKQEGIEAMLEDCLEIADDGVNDWMETQYGPKLNREAVERSKLRVDTRKWFASKILPKKYGDKIETTLKGDPNAPLQTRVVIVPPKQTADVQTKRIEKKED